MIEVSDVLINPYRPGVLDRMGFSFEAVSARNPKMIIAHLTGYGLKGPLASDAGHDINYISLSGALSFFGRYGERPMFPGNFAADFAGGGAICALGILIALLDRTKTGKG
jgi:alpha-methylacyl-CoA racemase